MQKLLALALAAILGAISTGSLAAKVTEKTEYYSVSGKTGGELVRSMMRKGPRHGFLSKAIAVTRFKASPYGDLAYKNGACRTKGAGFALQISYVFPRPSEKLPADVSARWRPFIAGVKKHEKAHGRIGAQMAAEIDGKIRGFAMKDKPDCRKAMATVVTDVSAIVKKYEKKQTDFDTAEHKPNGNVERLIEALIGKK